MKRNLFSFLLISLILISFSFQSQAQASSKTIKLDSTFRVKTSKSLVGYEKTIYKYDQKKRLVESKWIDYVELPKYQINFGYITNFKYDSDGMLIEQSVQAYEPYEKKWYLSLRTEKTYKKGVISTIIQYKDIQGELLPSNKDEYTYLNDGHQLDHFVYNDAKKEWKIKSREKFLYDISGNLVKRTEWEVLSDGSLNFVKQDAIAYNSKGLRTLYEKQIYMALSQKWFTTEKVDYTYDDKNQETLRSYSKDIDGNMTLYSKVQTTYSDANNRVVDSMAYKFYNGTQKWGNLKREELNFDNNNNLISNIISIEMNAIGSSESELVKYSRNVLDVDADQSIKNIAFPTKSIPFFDALFPVYLKNKVNTMHYAKYDNRNKEWKDDSDKVTFFYSKIEGVPTAVNEVLSEELLCYPNPVVKQLNVVLPDQNHSGEIMLFSVDGKLIVKQNVQKNFTIEMGNLKKGTYILQINCGSKVLKKKILR
ncbi:MAG: T9SS type A sorting domain-containing protein [Bacteroidales bacterium]